MFEILDTISGVEINRDLDRTLAYGPLYWSANKVNFDPLQMAQHDFHTYRGKLFIGRAKTNTLLHDALPNLLGKGLRFAQVMEAFWFGVNTQKLIHEHKNILAPGSLGHPPDSSRMFCPLVFEFGNSISLGIELIKTNAIGELIFPAKTKVLLMEK